MSTLLTITTEQVTIYRCPHCRGHRHSRYAIATHVERCHRNPERIPIAGELYRVTHRDFVEGYRIGWEPRGTEGDGLCYDGTAWVLIATQYERWPEYDLPMVHQLLVAAGVECPAEKEPP